MYLAGTRLNHSAKATGLTRTLISKNKEHALAQNDFRRVHWSTLHSIAFSGAHPKTNMSISPPTTTTSTGTDNPTAVRHLTYWCHECDMSVLLSPPPVSSTSPPLCPHCRHDFLEQMDSFPPPPPHPTSSAATFQPISPADTHNNPFPYPLPSPSDDTFLLDSPYFHRLVNNLITATTTGVAHNNHPTNPPRYNSPASKSAIESLHHVAVDSAFLEKDPTIVCPVCKDQFLINSEAKVLPCKHTYHSDCIVPWLEINNSCPVCRHRLPSEYDARKREVQGGGESFIGAARLNELLDEEQDLFGFTSLLRNVMRRHQQNASDNEEHNRNVENWNRRVVWDNEVLFSPTQIGEADSGGSGRRGEHVERANSVETVTSWPTWLVEGGAGGSGSGDGDIGGVGVSRGRGVSEGDAVRS